MGIYKHFSFDLWLTLIKSNPAFKHERNLFFHRHLNALNKTIEEIAAIFRQVDLMCNAINEKTGGNIDSREMYLMVYSFINDHQASIHDIDLDWLEAEMEKLFFLYAPLHYSNDTKNTLEQLIQHQEHTLNILCNTGFIKGSMMRKILKHLELSQYFDFQLYSDEAGMSKPNPDFFRLMISRVHHVRVNKTAGNHEIIHIGDNLLADVGGAHAAGIQSLQVNSNNIPISNILHAG